VAISMKDMSCEKPMVSFSIPLLNSSKMIFMMLVTALPKVFQTIISPKYVNLL
jgi:hypothetical protein